MSTNEHMLSNECQHIPLMSFERQFIEGHSMVELEDQIAINGLLLAL